MKRSDHSFSPLDVETETIRMEREVLAAQELPAVPPDVPGWKLRPLDQVQYDAIGDVVLERMRQDAKWGEQNHPEAMWLAILAEEFGEVAKDRDFSNNFAEMEKLRAELGEAEAE